MKNLVLALTALLITSTATAQDKTGAQISELYAFNFQPKSTLSNLNIKDGNVVVDFDAKTLTLKLGDKVSTTVPLLKTETGTCRETIYTGSRGENFADGMFHEIKVIDNSTNVCETFQRLVPTEVQFRIVGGIAGFNETHTLEGQSLLNRYASAELSNFNIQPSTALAAKNIQFGNIIIDRVQKMMTLSLYPRSNCPAGALCTMMLVATYINLPLDTVLVNRCNATVYSSKLAPVPALDNAPARLIVLDRTQSLCVNNKMFSTTVKLNVHGFINEAHTMDGGALN